MTKIAVVQEIYRELQELEAESAAQGDSPRVKALIRLFTKLTAPFVDGVAQMPAPACKHEKIEQGVCLQCGGTIPSLQTGEPGSPLPQTACPHANINPYGVCRDCGTCLHAFRNSSGICNQCGDVAELEAQSMAPAPEPGGAL